MELYPTNFLDCGPWSSGTLQNHMLCASSFFKVFLYKSNLVVAQLLMTFFCSFLFSHCIY